MRTICSTNLSPTATPLDERASRICDVLGRCHAALNGMAGSEMDQPCSVRKSPQGLTEYLSEGIELAEGLEKQIHSLVERIGKL